MTETTTAVDPLSSGIDTSEGAQEMTERGSAGAEELLRELAQLRNEEHPHGAVSSQGQNLFTRLRDAFK